MKEEAQGIVQQLDAFVGNCERMTRKQEAF